MANPTVIHIEQPIVIDRGNPTELIFPVVDPPEAGIDTWEAEFKLRTAWAPDGEEVDTIDAEMNQGEDGEDEEGSIRVIVESDVTDELDAGGHYRWDLWRTDVTPPRLLAVGTCTIKKNVRYPADA